MSNLVSNVIFRLSSGESLKSVIPVINEFSESDFKKLLDNLAEAYYHKIPYISDEYYDVIESIYENKYGKNTQIGAPLPQRPTGGKINKVKLPYYMGSLDKIKDDRPLSLWKSKYKDCDFVVTDKLDGNSVCIEYKNGVTRMFKRGDESEGADISYLLPYIKHPDIDFDLTVRGEIVMPLDIFKSKYQNENKNTRNMVSGLTNSKIIEVNKIRDIDIVAYTIYSDPPLPQSKQLDLLKSYGFKVPSISFLKYDELTADNLSYEVKKRRNVCPYDMDGIVISADIPCNFPSQGNPKHMIAFKIAGDMVVTTVKFVEWNVSKHGLFKPKVHIEPIQLSGVTVSKASGFNAKFIVEKGVGPGAQVIITRGGDVIPDIVDVIKSVDPDLPDDDCIWNDNGVELIVPYNSENSQQNIKRIVTFFKELGAKYLADTTISKLYDNGIDSINKFIKLKVCDIVDIEGFNKKSAERLIDNIQKVIRDNPMYKVMAASSYFPGFGSKRLKLITDYIPALQNPELLDSLEPEIIKSSILKIKGFNKLADIFRDNLQEFTEFIRNNPEITIVSGDDSVVEDFNETECKEELISGGGCLSNDVIVFSGTRPTLILERDILRCGGKVASGVSGKTTLLVVKEMSNSTKVQDAVKRGIKIMTKLEFLSKYNLQE